MSCDRYIFGKAVPEPSSLCPACVFYPRGCARSCMARQPFVSGLEPQENWANRRDDDWYRGEMCMYLRCRMSFRSVLFLRPEDKETWKMDEEQARRERTEKKKTRRVKKYTHCNALPPISTQRPVSSRLAHPPEKQQKNANVNATLKVQK